MQHEDTANNQISGRFQFMNLNDASCHAVVQISLSDIVINYSTKIMTRIAEMWLHQIIWPHSGSTRFWNAAFMEFKSPRGMQFRRNFLITAKATLLEGNIELHRRYLKHAISVSMSTSKSVVLILPSCSAVGSALWLFKLLETGQ